ncbi:MAG: site-2 protease family protein [Nitrospiraceae bacterium]
MNSLAEILHTISYMALPLFLAMVLHEYAHGWVANHYGDATARLQGRLTLNPLVHIDPFGSIILPLICLLLPGGFFLGWAKPVPINPAQLRNPRRDMALVAAAGPGMNLLLAIASAILFSAILSIDPTLSSYWSQQPAVTPRRDVLGMLLLPLAVMSAYSILINLLLMLFNLIPIPPLDGGRIMTSLLPSRWAMSMARLEPYGMLIIVGLIMLDPHIHVIQTITGTLVNVMAGAILSTVGVH